jgi:hypothetical protein
MDKVIVATLFAHSDVGDLFWLFVQRVFEVFAGDGEAGPLISLKELVYHHISSSGNTSIGALTDRSRKAGQSLPS